MFSEYIIYRSLLHPQVLKWTCSFLSSSVVSATSWGHLDYIIILKQTNKQRTKGESSLKHTKPFTNEKGFLTPLCTIHINDSRRFGEGLRSQNIMKEKMASSLSDSEQP